MVASSDDTTTQPDASGGSGQEPTWGVGAVAERLGVAASTLRTWERRYGIGPSHRTDGGHRRYAARDIDRVELVRRLVGRGVAAQDAARVVRGMDLGELDRALEEPAPQPRTTSSADVVDSLVHATTLVDEERLEQLVTALIGRPGFDDTWASVLSPYLTRVVAERSIGELDDGAEDRAFAALVHGFQDHQPVRPQPGTASVLLGTDGATRESLPLYALQASLEAAAVSTELVDADGLEAAIDRTLEAGTPPDVVVLWTSCPSDYERLPSTRERSVLATGPGWPHEVRVAPENGEPADVTDVAGLAERVIDRIG